jgi:hypothetical protein
LKNRQLEISEKLSILRREMIVRETLESNLNERTFSPKTERKKAFLPLNHHHIQRKRNHKETTKQTINEKLNNNVAITFKILISLFTKNEKKGKIN